MTERRKRTRKKSLAHGDLFHVYIASDTPPEVCEFLSQLKQEGDFSYEILQIIAAHVHATQQPSPKKVQQRRAVDVRVDEPVQQQAAKSSEKDRKAKEPHSSDSVVPPVVEEETVPVSESTEDVPETQPEPPAPKVDPIQLLRQQRRALVASASN